MCFCPNNDSTFSLYYVLLRTMYSIINYFRLLPTRITVSLKLPPRGASRMDSRFAFLLVLLFLLVSCLSATRADLRIATGGQEEERGEDIVQFPDDQTGPAADHEVLAPPPARARDQVRGLEFLVGRCCCLSSCLLFPHLWLELQTLFFFSSSSSPLHEL